MEKKSVQQGCLRKWLLGVVTRGNRRAAPEERLPAPGVRYLSSGCNRGRGDSANVRMRLQVAKLPRYGVGNGNARSRCITAGGVSR